MPRNSASGPTPEPPKPYKPRAMPDGPPASIRSAAARAAVFPSGTGRPITVSRERPSTPAVTRRPIVIRALARCDRAIAASVSPSTARTSRSSTPTANVCVAVNPPGSSAVTATAADPYTTGVSVSNVPATDTVTTSASDDAAR